LLKSMCRLIKVNKAIKRCLIILAIITPIKRMINPAKNEGKEENSFSKKFMRIELISSSIFLSPPLEFVFELVK